MNTITGYLYYPDSLVTVQGDTLFMARSEDNQSKLLGVIGDPAGFQQGQGIAAGKLPLAGRFPAAGSAAGTHLFPLTAENAAALRARLPWLQPQPLGLRATAGFGDRLGLATPGHARALRSLAADGAPLPIAPVFAQQSVRENARTGRSPQQVLDEAMWGLFEFGWRLPWGADADHLKTPADLDAFFDAGYTFFTIDPGEHVDSAAQLDALPDLRKKAAALPWQDLAATPAEMEARYLGVDARVEDFTLSFSEQELLQALVKYGGAIAHAVRMARRLAERAATRGGPAPDLEMSVDETTTPTTAQEHFFIASELRRLGVPITSLAPRFTGSFEKGVDFIGDLAEFEADFARHAALARYFGSYRLSLHSGSDKFSLYPAAARLARGLLHLKTAGTSYLEALRVVARGDPALFRQILELALERYPQDRASYHVSARVEQVPAPGALADADLPALLDQFDARQVLHVTFGAALERHQPALVRALRAAEDPYYEALDAHFRRHLEPLRYQ